MASGGAPLLREGIPVVVLEAGVARTVAALQSSVSRTLTAHLVVQGGELILTLSDLAARSGNGDLLLLRHTLTAATYGTLRDSQALRVDFSGFPLQLAELLRRPAVDSAFVAVLSLGTNNNNNNNSNSNSGDRFEIVQLSQFRLLAHIELELERATADELLDALQLCIRENMSENESMRRVEEGLRNELVTTQTRLREAEERCGEMEALRTAANNADAATAAADASRQTLEATRRELLAASREASELRQRVGEMEDAARISGDRLGRLTSERDEYRTRAAGFAEKRMAEIETRLDEMKATNRKLADSNEQLSRERDSERRKLKAAERAAEETAVVLASDRECIAFLNRELNRRDVLLGTPTPEILKTPTRRGGSNEKRRGKEAQAARRRTSGVSATGATTAVS